MNLKRYPLIPPLPRKARVRRFHPAGQLVSDFVTRDWKRHIEQDCHAEPGYLVELLPPTTSEQILHHAREIVNLVWFRLSFVIFPKEGTSHGA